QPSGSIGWHRMNFHAAGGERNARAGIVGGFLRAEDHYLAALNRANELAVDREPKIAVEDNANQRPAWLDAADGEQRVIRRRGADADENRIAAAAQFMDDPVGGAVADLHAFAAGPGDFSIGALRPFQRDIGPAMNR